MTPKVREVSFIRGESQFVGKLERLLNEKQIDMVASLLIQYATRATPSYGKFGGDFFSVILLRNYPSLIIKMLKLKNDQLNQALLTTVCEGLKAFGPDWRKYTSLERSRAVEAVLAATHPADIRDLNGGFASKALRRFAADETIPAIPFLSDMAFMQSIGDSCNTPEDVAALRHLVDREMNKVLQDNPANIASIRAMGQGYVVALRSAIRFTGQRGPEGMALLLLQKIFDFPLPELRLVTLTKRSMHKELSSAPALAEQTVSLIRRAYDENPQQPQHSHVIHIASAVIHAAQNAEPDQQLRFLRLIRDGFTEAGQAQVLTTLLTVDALKGYDATTLIRFGAGLYAPDHKECRERVEAAFSLKTPLDQINGLLRVAYDGHLSVGTIAYFENLVDKTEQLIQIRAGTQKLTDIKFDPNAAFIIDTICRPPPSNAMQTGALASVYEMIDRHVDPGTLKNAFRMKRRALPADQRAAVNQHFNAAKKAFLPLCRAVGNVYLPMRIAGYAGRAVTAVIPSRLLPKPGLGGG